MSYCPLCDNKGKIIKKLNNNKMVIKKCKRCEGVKGGYKSLKVKRGENMSDYAVNITIGEEEIEFNVEIDAYVEDEGFSHEFGYKECLSLVYDNVTSLERVIKSTFTGINKWSGRCEYDIETKSMDFNKLREGNQWRILEAINGVLEGVSVSDFNDEQQDY